MKDRILRRLDSLLQNNDYSGAEKHLLYWLQEAEASNDRPVTLLICNELMGLYRKLGREADALCFSKKALKEIEEMNIPDNIGAATTYINCATVFKAFSLADKAMPLFEKAKRIYEEKLGGDDPRLGGLYNNMALALVDLMKFDEADLYYNKALSVMKAAAQGESEAAITYLNMASAAEARLGGEKAEAVITDYLSRAMELLDKNEHRRDGGYAFVCEKCASVFGYYGYFLYEKELKERSRRIYEGT